MLPVVNNYKPYKDKPKYQFTVCGPILYSVSDPNELVNMIEINMMFGANHFIFYDDSVSGKALEYLKKYQNEGLVDIITWKLPPGVKTHYRGQAFSVIDCHYRNMYISKYIAYFDADEVIVPKSFSNWSQILSNVLKINGPNLCAAVLWNVFYRADLKQPQVLNGSDDKTAKKYNIKPLSVTIRDNIVTVPGHTKWIGDPLHMTLGSVHYPQICYRNATKHHVNEAEGLMFHYRIRPYYNKPTMQDTFMLRHKEEILKQVVARHKKFQPLQQTSTTTSNQTTSQTLSHSQSASHQTSTTKSPNNQNTTSDANVHP